MKTIILLAVSNVFMTFAWYGHLKFKHSPLWLVVIASWLIAFAEYCFQVPANRIGQVSYGFSTAQLKVMQEVITLVIFGIFVRLYMKETPGWNFYAAFAFIIAAVFLMFKDVKLPG